MRVLFASNYPHLPDIRGGLQTTTHDLCVAMQNVGADAAVLCGLSEHGAVAAGAGARADEALGYPVFRAPDPERALPLVAAAWNATVIVVQSGTALAPMLLASLGTGRATAVYLHNVETHQLHGSLRPDPSILFLSNSDFTARRWRALFGIECAVIPPVVDGERYYTPTTGDQVLFVNPTPIKGVELMFNLAAQCPDLPFLAVESWNLEPTWRRHCRWRAMQLGNVEWQEPTDDMRGVYARGRVLLMPSVWEESFGRTVVEAQLNGLPVLASNRGALVDNVGDGGLTLDPHAPVADWADALRRLYVDGEGWGDAARRKGLAHAGSTPVIAGDLLSLLAAHAQR